MRDNRPLRTFARLINGHPFASEDFQDSGELPVIRIRDLGDAPFSTFISDSLVPAHAQIEDGHVLIGMDGEFNVRLWDRGRAALNQRVCKLEANSTSDARFLAYSLSHPLQTINDLTYATTVKHISGGQILRIMLPDFSLLEQRSIADFLDRETAQIDAMIEAQEALQKALLERRTSVMEQMVFGSGTPSAADEQAPWIPTIPAHWKMGKVLHGYEVTLGKMLDEKRPPNDDDVQTPYIRAANIQDEGLDLDDLKSMPFRPSELNRLDLRNGDLLVVEGGSIGTNVFLEKDLPGMSFQKTVNRVRPRSDQDARYLGFVLTILRDRGVLHMMGNQSTIAHFTAEKLGALRIPYPPAAEQTAIADSIVRETQLIDTAIQETTEVASLLRERREALITAAVTGRIDPETGTEYPDITKTPASNEEN